MFAILYECKIVFNWATMEIHCCCFSSLYFGVRPLRHLSIVWLCLALSNCFLLNCRAGIEAPHFEAAQRLLFCSVGLIAVLRLAAAQFNDDRLCSFLPASLFVIVIVTYSTQGRFTVIRVN